MVRKFNVLAYVVVLLFVSTYAHAGEYINEHLPKWVNVDLQLRHRYEWRSDFDFNENIYDKDGFNLWRTRIGVTIKPNDEFKLFYQFQDSRVSDDSTTGSKAVYENWADTRQLWAEFKSKKLSVESVGLDSIGIKAGRQEFVYGAQRLIGAFDWSNVAQTFDGGKVSFDFAPHQLAVDFFGGGKTAIKAPREMDDFYDGAGNDRVLGYYGTYKGIKDVTIEQYLFNRNTDGQTISFGQTGDGEIEDYTFGARVAGKIPNTGFDYEIEAAKQVGNSGALDADAQMAIGIIGYTFDHAFKPRVSFEYDYGSGDSDPTDSKRSTFNNLYPTNHSFYGYIDFVSLQNVNDYRFQLKLDPTKKLNLSADFHLVYLDTPKDNLYAANRSIKRSTRSGADDPWVGNEIDLLAKYQATKYLGIMAGYSHFIPGKFLDQTGSDDAADFVYIQTTLSF